MKKENFLITVVLIFITNSIYAQYSSSNKSIVYIGALEKNATLIQYFNNEKLIGYTEKKEYLMYECNPGKQLFWSKVVPLKKKSPKAESFLELDLESGKVYYLNVSTTTTNGKRLKKSVKKDKGNLIHQLVVLEDTYLINQFIEKISKKKPNTYKDKKLRKWNEELYSQITTSLYEYNQKNPIVSQNINVSKNIKKEISKPNLVKEIPLKKVIEKDNTSELSIIVQNTSKTLKELEQDKLDAISEEDYALANELKKQINLKKEELENNKTDTNSLSIEELEINKKKALIDENYILANDLKEQITFKKEEALKLEKENLINIDELEISKQKAIEDENYELANKLKEQIKIEKEKKKSNPIQKTTSSIEELEYIKEKAVAEEDYALAGDIDKKIELLKLGNLDNNNNVENQSEKVNESNDEIEKLNLEKDNAIASEDYILAGELKEQIVAIEKEANNSNSLNNLKLAKQNAINNEDYILAGELKIKIELIEKEGILSNLLKEKEDAIANENYLLAGEINKKIAIHNGTFIEEKPDSTTEKVVIQKKKKMI